MGRESAGCRNNTTSKLIVIMLRGAVDGLSVVVPYGDANYYRLRPAIAVPRPGAGRRCARSGCVQVISV